MTSGASNNNGPPRHKLRIVLFNECPFICLSNLEFYERGNSVLFHLKYSSCLLSLGHCCPERLLFKSPLTLATLLRCYLSKDNELVAGMEFLYLVVVQCFSETSELSTTTKTTDQELLLIHENLYSGNCIVCNEWIPYGDL